jgi:hypothetical protein
MILVYLNQDGQAATHTFDVVTLFGGTVLISSQTTLEQLLFPKNFLASQKIYQPIEHIITVYQYHFTAKQGVCWGKWRVHWIGVNSRNINLLLALGS